MTYIPAEQHQPRRTSAATAPMPRQDVDARRPHPHAPVQHVQPLPPEQTAPWRDPAVTPRRIPEQPGRAVYEYGGVAHRPRRDFGPGVVIGHLVRIAVLAALAAAVTWGALRTVSGQWLDENALQESQQLYSGLPVSWAAAVDAAPVLIALVCGLAALAVAAASRRWIPLLIGLLTAAGSAGTVQLLKHSLLSKPAYGIQEASVNSLPSGHTATAAAAAALLVLVTPAAWRPLVAFASALLTGLAGLSTVLAGWHRPADVIVAVLVVAAWTVLGSLLIKALARPERWSPQRGLVSTLLLMLVVVAGLVTLMGMETMPMRGLALLTGVLGIAAVCLFSSVQTLRAMRPRRR